MKNFITLFGGIVLWGRYIKMKNIFINDTLLRIKNSIFAIFALKYFTNCKNPMMYNENIFLKEMYLGVEFCN